MVATPTPQPTPDPRVELEAHLADLETQLAKAKADKVRLATGNDDAALTSAMDEAKRITAELETARTELKALEAVVATPATASEAPVSVGPADTLLEQVLNRVGETNPDIQKALEAFVASAENGQSEANTRLIKKFLDDPNKRPEWIISKAMNAVQKRTVVAST